MANLNFFSIDFNVKSQHNTIHCIAGSADTTIYQKKITEVLGHHF